MVDDNRGIVTVVLQPTPFCNIDCSYCYLAERGNRAVMDHAVVEAAARTVLARLRPETPATLVWHGGEPTAAPLAWFERAYEILAPYRDRCRFSLQTNAIAIDAPWVALLKATQTHVGVSIDGPCEFHDRRRVTRTGKGTFERTRAGLRRLVDAGLAPTVITVLSPDALNHPDAFFAFYREEGVRVVTFNIDEAEAANASSSFNAARDAPRMRAFLTRILHLSRETGYELVVPEIERIAGVLGLGLQADNEQVRRWGIVLVDHLGRVGTYSPELADVDPALRGLLRYGSVLDGSFESWDHDPLLSCVASEIEAGVASCAASCRYFAVCGGGAPVNKLSETGTFASAETDYCRLTTQASTDALIAFIDNCRAAGAGEQSVSA